MERLQSLRRALRAHGPADGREAGFRDDMLRLLDVPGDPLSRRHFDPGHFTASGFVLEPTGTCLLMIDHRRLARWLQPGGHVEPADADLVDAARREVVEESGLAAADLEALAGGPLDLDVHVIPAHGKEPEHRHFDIRFLFLTRSRRLAAGSEVKAACWIPLERATLLNPEPAMTRVALKLSRYNTRPLPAQEKP